MKLLITCEHGGNHIPEKYQSFFKNETALLQSHRGYDLGALDVFKHIKSLADYACASETSRLLIELNRSLHHPHLFSSVTKVFSKDEKNNLIQNYYLPYRKSLERIIKNHLQNEETVIHISVHSFTPVFNGVVRNASIGLLFDPSRKNERRFCLDFKNNIQKQNSHLKVRFNYPYLGKADGFTTYLRKVFPKNYMGIEIEINQQFSFENKMPMSLKNALLLALGESIAVWNSNSIP